MRGIAGSSLAALAVGIAGCGNTATNVVNHVSEEGPPAGVVVGEPTTVGFRADALGAARDLPVPVGTDSINGAMVTLSGTLHKATADWIVIDDTSADQRHWIRIESINWIRQPIPQEPAPSAATPAGPHADEGGQASDGGQGEADHGGTGDHHDDGSHGG